MLQCSMFKAQCIYRMLHSTMFRGISRTTTKSEMELFVIKENGWKSKIFITKSSILDFALALGMLLMLQY